MMTIYSGLVKEKMFNNFGNSICSA